MKRFVLLVVVAVVVTLAGSALAGIGSKLKQGAQGTVEGAAKGTAESGINSELAKPQYQCNWNKAANKVEGCDLKKIAAYLSSQNKAAEKAGTTDYDINVHIKDYDGFMKVKEGLQLYGVGSYDINRRTDNITGEQVKFTVNMD